MTTEGQQGVSPAAGAPAGVRSIAPYRPGRPIGEVARELGLDPAGIVKLASNENPLGMSPKAVAAAQQVLAGGARYPDANGHDLKQALARHYGVDAGWITLGNGSNDILELAARSSPMVACAVEVRVAPSAPDARDAVREPAGQPSG